MSTAIIYASKYGTTKKVASMISDKLEEPNTVLYDLNENPNPNTSKFNSIIVGGSIHAGRIQKKVIDFLNNNKEEIYSKSLGLFVCCMHEDIAEEKLNSIFPVSFKSHAIAFGQLGGEYKFKKTTLFEKIIVRKVKRTSNSIMNLEQQAIDIFVNDFITLR